MTPLVASIALPLFVPADRPDRFDKALAAGADAVILDLEDAVAAGAKEMARSTLGAAFDQLAAAACPVIVRVKAEDTPFHAADLDTCRALPLRAVMVPKVEAADTVARVAARTGMPVLALIESARGLAAARTIAASGARLFFGSIDYTADLGCAHTREALLLSRLKLLVASRLAGGPIPLDGVTAGIKDLTLVGEDAAYAVSLGFAGKLLIHPAQIARPPPGCNRTRSNWPGRGVSWKPGGMPGQPPWTAPWSTHPSAYGPNNSNAELNRAAEVRLAIRPLRVPAASSAPGRCGGPSCLRYPPRQ